MGRLLFHSTPRPIVTMKHLNNAIIDNQQLNVVFSMVRDMIENCQGGCFYVFQQEQTLDRLTEQLHQCLANAENNPVPLEFERLIVPEQEETSIDDEDQEEDDEMNSRDQIIRKDR